ncbi:alcohol dehydrogenase catalytic domain-containing protein [Maridesulfovibrio frigidus]|uniref:alcohol dehydrogenase catalytic domain-containing protein n=1 Tax=Maridesulfovibrio frigidus TaxID=340956 RepID=UPI0004E26D0A|nr:alcohol dehydrogenase catalytic domain-containing protein [Maridesulfovibrio frigidus]
MKAAYIKTHKKVQIRDIETPVPESREVLLQIDGCGVCGSDYIEATSWAKKWKRFGHEIAATVLNVGEEVKDFTQGDQVALALSAPCGECPICLSGNKRGCCNIVVAEQGGFAKNLLVKDVRLLSKVPHPISPSLLILVEPLTVLLDAFHTANLKQGDTLAVVGGGFLSCLAHLVANVMGSKPTISLSRSLHPGLEACLQAVGGEHFKWKTLGGVTISPPKAFPAKLAESPGRVTVLHTAPARYLQNYMDFLPFDSTIVNIGLSGKSKDNTLKIDFSKLIFKRLQLLSGFPVPCLYLDEAVELLCNNKDLFSILSPEIMHLDQLPKVITATHKAKKKIMIVPTSVGHEKQ